MNPRRKPRRVLWLMGAMLFVATLAGISQGAMKLTLATLWQPDSEALRYVWLHIRLPRVMLAILVGGGLALSGCVMQSLFRNPLADPGLLGISSGAALFVGLAIIFPVALPALLALYLPMLAAFVGSLVVTLIIFMLSRSGDGNLTGLLLVGIAINALGGAAAGILSWISNDIQLRQLSLWGMGSLGQAQWSTVLAITSMVIPAGIATGLLARKLNLLQLGDEEAHYLGVAVKRTQGQLLIASALLVAASVAVCGVIGFVGLVVPHLIRRWVGADNRWLVPGSALAGALLLLVADTLARTLVAPAEMPVGLITSLTGSPFFLAMIFQQRRKN